MYNFYFCLGLNLLNGSSRVHTFLNEKLDNYTPCLYNVQTRNEGYMIWDKF
jgi:hypothetical protein